MARAAAPKRVSSLGSLKMNAKGMSSLLGLKSSWFHELVRDGVIPKEGSGTYDPMTVIQAYIAYVKDFKANEAASAPSSLDDLRELKAKEIVVNLALKDRKLISLDEAIGTFDQLVGHFNAFLSGLPAELSRNMQERQRIDDVIQNGRQRLHDRFEKVADTLATGSSSAETASENGSD